MPYGYRSVPHPSGVGRALEHGIALVPEERRSQGVSLGATIQDNIAIANLSRVSNAGWVSASGIARLVSTQETAVRSPEQNTGPNVFYLGADRAVLDVGIAASRRQQPQEV